MDRLDPRRILAYSLSVAFLVFSLSTAYYFVVFLPNHKKSVFNYELEKATTNRVNLNKCLQKAESDYTYVWDSQCRTLGRKDDCMLPDYAANDVERLRSEDRAICIKRFPPVN